MEEDVLDDLITYLETLKEQGKRYVQISAEGMAALDSLLAPQKKIVPQPVREASIPIATSFVPQSAATGKYTRISSVSGQENPFNNQPLTTTSGKAMPIRTPKIDIQLDLTQKLTLEQKQEKLKDLQQQILQCQKCPHLVAARHKVVFGVGDPDSPLMFVGEAPGADEDMQGEPFVGRAGQLLMKIIAAMGLSREQVFIGNILKCRPDTPGQTSGNRPPTPNEMAICLPWLLKQIEIVQPKVIVALGATAINGLLSETMALNKIRGKFRNFHGINVMPTYHPSFLLRYASPEIKRKVWEDMMAVMEKLEMPISEKQKGYFLPKAN